MSEYDFLINVAGALLAALVGGMAARLLKLPVLVGYLAAGVAVGPHTPGFLADEEAVYAVAKLGAALLMFAVGVQLSLDEMRPVKKTAIGGGAIQIIGTIILGTCLGLALGWSLYSGIFLGCALALTSTTIMMRVLEERGEIGEGHGSVMLGIAIVQDIALIVMVTLLPELAVLSKEGLPAVGAAGLSILRSLALVSVAIYLALKGVPYILAGAARTGVRELFVLTVVCLCLVAAYGAHVAGLSLEIGAFLAGLAISGSRYAHEVLAQVRPLRDLFASLFFVSIGMLWNPAFLAAHWVAVLAVVLAIIVGKALITAFAISLFGWHGRTVLLAGIGLAQIGEFSFVLAAIGTERNLIPELVSGVILSAALITLLLAPFTYAGAAPLYIWLNSIPVFSRLMNRGGAAERLTDVHEPPEHGVIVAGSGRVGKHISDTLRAKNIPHVVVDLNSRVIEHRRRHGVPAIYGDASSDVVISQTHPGTARLAFVALPDAGSSEATIRHLKRMSPALPVLARVHRGADIPRIREAGADGVVHAEFEASAQMIVMGLKLLGLPENEITEHVSELRRRRYGVA